MRCYILISCSHIGRQSRRLGCIHSTGRWRRAAASDDFKKAMAEAMRAVKMLDLGRSTCCLLWQNLQGKRAQGGGRRVGSADGMQRLIAAHPSSSFELPEAQQALPTWHRTVVDGEVPSSWAAAEVQTDTELTVTSRM